MPTPTKPRRPIPPKPGSRPRPAATAAPQGIILPDPDRSLPLLRTSDRGQFKRCGQRWWWGSVEGLGTSGPPDVKLWLGTGWHLVMAHIYSKKGLKRGTRPHDVWDEYVEDQLIKIRVNVRGESWDHEPFVDAKILVHQMIDGYLEKYQGDPSWYVIQAEQVGFAIIPRKDSPKIPLVQYAVTYDLVYRDEARGDTLWLGEHKTAKAISTNHLDLDNQAGSYFAIATLQSRKLGLLGPREYLKGVMYNFARKSPPDEREVASDGLVHNKPGKEEYQSAFIEHDIDPELYSSGRGLKPLRDLAVLADENGIEVLGKVAAYQPKDNFERFHVVRSRAEVRSQIEHIQDDFMAMEATRQGLVPVTKNPTKDCNWDCSYKEMCLLHERGANWEEFRDAMYVKVDAYEPYRKSASLDE